MFIGKQNPPIILSAFNATKAPFGNLILSEINGSQASLTTSCMLSRATISSDYKEIAQMLLKMHPSALPLYYFQHCLTKI